MSWLREPLPAKGNVIARSLLAWAAAALRFGGARPKINATQNGFRLSQGCRLSSEISVEARVGAWRGIPGEELDGGNHCEFERLHIHKEGRRSRAFEEGQGTALRRLGGAIHFIVIEHIFVVAVDGERPPPKTCVWDPSRGGGRAR